MRFVVLAWALSRLLVLGTLLAGANASVLANWDGAWYGSIAQNGYEYARDGGQHNVAFFPLFPLIASPFVHHGLAWPVVGSAIANIAFLGALVVMHRIAKRRYDAVTANWCVTVACLLPPSLFCSVAYPQSLMLLFSAAAIDLWDGKRTSAAGGCGALASGTSPLGIPLAFALLLDAVLQRRMRAVLAASFAFVGVGAFALYCALRFGDALAFVHAQRAWRTGGFGLDLHAWRAIFASLATIDGVRQNIMVVLLVPLGALATIIEASGVGRMMTIYALLALAMLAFSGTPFSVDRNAYAVVPVLIAFGAILRRVPPAGYVMLALCAVLLTIDAGRFARFEWVASLPKTASATVLA
jgi:Mannosyltransferase (PIG-V)